MKLLLVETTAYHPVSPLFAEACQSRAVSDSSFHWQLFDEVGFSWPWTFERLLLGHVKHTRPDLILFVKGALVTKECVQRLKEYGPRLVCYQTDDPWNPAACHHRVVDAIPLYDLYCTCKTAIMDDLVKAGAKKVAYVPCGYKKEIHWIQDLPVEAHRKPFVCDVAVIGGADEERVNIVRSIRKELPDLSLKLYGGYWDRHADLKPLHMGTVYGWEYRAAIRNAKVVLNVLRSANRDQHNLKTLEINACGGIQVSKHTQESTELIGNGSRYYAKDSDIPYLIQSTLLYLSECDKDKLLDGNYKPHTWNARLDQILGAL